MTTNALSFIGGFMAHENDYDVASRYISTLESRITDLETKMEWLMVRHHEAPSRCMPCVSYEEATGGIPNV